MARKINQPDYKALFESAPGLYLVLSPDLTIVGASDAYLDATMTTRDAIAGKNLFDVFPDNPDDPEATGVSNLRSSLKSVLTNRKAHTMAVQKYDIRKPDGAFEERYWSPLNKPVLNNKNEIVFIIHRVEDVTDFIRMKGAQSEQTKITHDLQVRIGKMEMEAYKRAQEIQESNRRLEEEVQEREKQQAVINRMNSDLEQKVLDRTSELKQSNEELERFAFIASHDLQEPLRMVASFLQLLKKRYHDELDETANQYINFAVDGADRMKKLISDLLEYSRVGVSNEDFTRVDLNLVMNDVTSLFQNSISSLGAKVEISPLPVVMGRRQQLLQLFQNLVSNALKYHGRETPQITIGCTGKGNFWEIFVKDNGIGIDPKFFEKIFIIFQRLHNKSEYSGTGIGLAICKRIVERHGGIIRVESEPGKGSTFFFTIHK